MIKINKYLIFLVFIFLFFIININTTKAATTTIDSIQDLYNVRNNLSGNYELGVNLDFDENSSYNQTTPRGISSTSEFIIAMTSGTGWLPIGDDYNHPFTGTFDGGSYKIINLKMSRGGEGYLGLFGNIYQSYLINISLENIDIVPTRNDAWSVGGLVGWSLISNIINSYTTGFISGREASMAVGGLIGWAEETIVLNSYSEVDVIGGEWGIGGLIGYYDNDNSPESVSSIENSYAIGDVSGTDDAVGGLVGCLDDGVIKARIINSYSTGIVSGTRNVGGLVGDIDGVGAITSSYYNTTTSGQSDNDGRGSPRTTAEMTYPYNTEATTTYVGWDFDTIWYHDTTGVVNNGYPFNYAAPDTTAPVISGLSNDATPAKTGTWSWSSDDESATYRYAVNQTATHTFTDEVYSTTTSTTQSSGNGTYYLHVQAKDTANNTSTTTVSAILDNTGPVITILGSNPVSVYVGDSYTDSGATALDAVDGNRTSSIVATNTVNTSVVGSYTVTYNVSDIAGNPATPVVRTVNIISRPGGGMPIYMLNSMNQQNQNNNTEPSNTISDTTSWTTGRWVKTSDSPVVYFVDTNNVRHAYSNEGIWKSYFNNDFSFVSTISKEELANYQLDRNVPFNINTLFKIPSIPKVYRVGNNRSISWIKTEELANKLYANNWNKLVKDLSDSLFGDYILEEDTDNDGLNDSDEEIYKTDKNNNDTDGDTYLDGEEVIHKYDPLKAANDKL